MHRQGGGFGEARIVAILARKHCKRDRAFARQRRQPLNAVTPPVESSEQTHEDNLGVLSHSVEPKVDREWVAQIPQVCEPHTGELIPLHRPGGRQTGQIAVRERENRDVPGRLAQIDGFDQVVDGSRGGRQKMHRSSQQRACDTFVIESLHADNDKLTFPCLFGGPRAIVVMAHARPDRLYEQTHRLASHGRKSLDA